MATRPANPLVPPSTPSAAERTGRGRIELVRLTKTFGRGPSLVTAVDHVTLTIQPGQVFGFLGPNGAGKTTVIKMICGLVTPTSGEVRVGGHDVGRQRSQAVRQIGAVLEGSRNVYWSMSAWDNLFYFGRLKGLSGKEIRPRAERLLTELGLWERRGQSVGGFSRGMQQKVAIAAALITGPPVLLLDEPTIGLDVEAARTVREWITKLARDGTTVILTTHELEHAQELSNRVAVIRQGRIVADLPTHELLNRYAEDRYEIRLAGSTQLTESALPDGSHVVADNGTMRVLLPTTDDGELHRTLGQVQRAGARLLSVEQVRPDLEEVFVRLVKEG
ncbi:MAG: ABC transporter ATP-binding protein [Chloroflexota bacterium]|nr:ABC transporter ATP-binding protein [Chloroflexota bacterium]